MSSKTASLRTGILSGYFCLIRSASALRFSVSKTSPMSVDRQQGDAPRVPKGCSSLNLDLILAGAAYGEAGKCASDDGGAGDGGGRVAG